MGDVQTSSQQSSLTNPAMQAAGTTIGNQLNSALQRGVSVDTTNRVPGLSSQTQQGVNALANNPLNSVYSGALGSTMGEFGAIASGQRFGTDDPGYAALRAKAGDDTLRDVNSIFANNGRFGSGSHVGTATESLGSVYAGLDYQNFQNDQQRQMSAAGMMPGLYQGAMMPGQAMLGAGQIVDANAAARSQEEARIWDAQNNAPWNTLQRGGAIFGGTAPVTGTTTNEAQPWWKVGLGLGTTALGFM